VVKAKKTRQKRSLFKQRIFCNLRKMFLRGDTLVGIDNKCCQTSTRGCHISGLKMFTQTQTFICLIQNALII